MKAIKSILIIIVFLFSLISFAQSHNTTAGSNCKYAKNRCINMEGCPQCEACNVNDKKEKTAKAEEVKKRNEKIWADAKIKKEAEQKAYRDQLAVEEKKRKSESGDVVINGQPHKMAIPQTSKKESSSSGYLRVYGDGFCDARSLQPIPKNNAFEYKSIEGTFVFNDKRSRNLFPSNIGVIQIEKQIDQTNYKNYRENWAKSYKVCDFVNEKQERIFNRDDISFIMHFYGDWFLIGYELTDSPRFVDARYLGKAKFYNVSTHEYIEILEYNNSGMLKIESIGRTNTSQYVHINKRYSEGDYSEYYTIGSEKRKDIRDYKVEILDNQLNGPDSWKSAIVIDTSTGNTYNSRSYILYYLDRNGVILKKTISKEDIDKLNY